MCNVYEYINIKIVPKAYSQLPVVQFSILHVLPIYLCTKSSSHILCISRPQLNPYRYIHACSYIINE